MSTIYNDKFYHTGVIGMKWGKRKMGQIKDDIKARNQMTKDQFAHPIHSTAAQLNLIRKSPLKALRADTETVKNLNTDVAKRVSDSKKLKTKKQVMDHRESGVKAVGNILKLAGNNVAAINRNNQAMKISKMITPD